MHGNASRIVLHLNRWQLNCNRIWRPVKIHTSTAEPLHQMWKHASLVTGIHTFGLSDAAQTGVARLRMFCFPLVLLSRDSFSHFFITSNNVCRYGTFFFLHLFFPQFCHICQYPDIEGTDLSSEQTHYSCYKCVEVNYKEENVTYCPVVPGNRNVDGNI